MNLKGIQTLPPVHDVRTVGASCIVTYRKHTIPTGCASPSCLTGSSYEAPLGTPSKRTLQMIRLKYPVFVGFQMYPLCMCKLHRTVKDGKQTYFSGEYSIVREQKKRSSRCRFLGLYDLLTYCSLRHVFCTFPSALLVPSDWWDGWAFRATGSLVACGKQLPTIGNVRTHSVKSEKHSSQST